MDDTTLRALLETLSPGRLTLLLLTAPLVKLITSGIGWVFKFTGNLLQLIAAFVTLIVFGVYLAFSRAWPVTGEDALALLLAIFLAWLGAIGSNEVWKALLQSLSRRRTG